MKRREMLIGAAVSGAAGIATIAAVTQSTQALAQAAPPLAAGGVLDRIIKEKKIRITAEVTSPPFGILDRNNQPDGSEIETSRQLAKDLGVELELVQVTSPQRIPALLAGRADVAISSLSITFDRAKTVMFAPPHGALSIVIAGQKKAQIRSAADMAGKKIGLTRATLEEATVPKIAPPGAQIVFFDDIAATLQAMVSGQVDAAGMSAFAAKSVADRNPKAEIENKFTVTTAFYAAAVRPGDFDLLQFLRTWVFLNRQNGVLANIYKKYTEVALVDLPAF
jgi:polar amino acid transport system substrate-binding protein